jgi:hypothetical protein
MGWVCSSHGKKGIAYKLLGGKARRKITMTKTLMRGDKIKMELRQIGWVGTDWIHLAQIRDHWTALVTR